MAQHYSVMDLAMPVCAEVVAATHRDGTELDSDSMVTNHLGT